MEWSTYILIYIGICYTAFRFPWLLHKRLPDLKKDRKETKLWIIAHRGGSYEKPENTLEAFDNSKYADMLELDVVGTKDNIVVVSHDSNICRLTGHNLDMSTLSYSELPQYKKTFFSHFLEEDFQCDREYHYTTLESVFARFPHNYISVDIKCPTEEIILEIKRLASDYNRTENTVKTI